MKKLFLHQQKGEVATIITLTALAIMVLGTFVGGKLVQTGPRDLLKAVIPPSLSCSKLEEVGSKHLINDYPQFRCFSTLPAHHYNFRYQVEGDGQYYTYFSPNTLYEANQSGLYYSQPASFQIRRSGGHIVQCQACLHSDNSSCNQWATAMGLSPTPFLTPGPLIPTPTPKGYISPIPTSLITSYPGSCSESDGGDNPFVGSGADSCSTKVIEPDYKPFTYLTEYYCNDGKTALLNRSYPCPFNYSCLNNACIAPTATPTFGPSPTPTFTPTPTITPWPTNTCKSIGVSCANSNECCSRYCSGNQCLTAPAPTKCYDC